MPEQSTDDVHLLEATDTDVRYVAIVWRNREDGESRPVLEMGGTHCFEAAGLLRAALLRLEADNADLVDLEGEEEDDEYDE